MNRLYVQALLLAVVPLVIALSLLLAHNRTLVESERALRRQELAEANRQAQFALGQHVDQIRQMARLLARSREVETAMAERNTQVLHAWGNRMIGVGVASEAYFVGSNGTILARGHEEFRFNDAYAGPLAVSGAEDGAAAGIEPKGGGGLALTARVPVRRFDVQQVGYVVLFREITPKLLAGLGVHPAVNVELRRGPGPRGAAATRGTLAVSSFDLAPEIANGAQYHLQLSRDFSEEAARIDRLEATLWIMAAVVLLILPAVIGYLLYRLLRPARLLYRRLREFSADSSNPGRLVADVAALAESKNELGAIAGSVAGALQALQTTQTDLVQAQKLAALGALVAGIAHELNTPLGNSRVVAGSLRERAKELAAEIGAGTVRRSSLDRFFADCREATDILERSLERASNLVASFKHVAVDQAGAQRRAYQLHEVTYDVLLTLRPSLKKLPIRVLEEVPEGIRMDGYPGALGQVLTNLVQNAAIHGLEGAEQGEIRVSAEQRGETVVLRVADDGHGIAPENAGRIFEPFFTTRLGAGGSGLGLNISRKLVTEVLGGTIAVQSEPGHGATFTLELPRVAPREGGDRRRNPEANRLSKEAA